MKRIEEVKKGREVKAIRIRWGGGGRVDGKGGGRRRGSSFFMSKR